MEIRSLEDLLADQLEDLYDAEHRDLELLPALIEAADDETLVVVLQEHHEETRQHRRRLEECFDRLGRGPARKECPAMAGLVAEAEQVLDSGGPAAVVDAGIVAVKRRVAHYEMAGYDTARDYARELGRHGVADLLQETLDEEGSAESEFAELARSVLIGSAREAGR